VLLGAILALGGTGESAAQKVRASASVRASEVIAPVITSPEFASGQAGVPFSYQITADNDPTSFGATGLPPGLQVNASTGLISGTPTASDTFFPTVSATNAAGTGTLDITMSITAAAPVAKPATLAVPLDTPTDDRPRGIHHRCRHYRGGNLDGAFARNDGSEGNEGHILPEARLFRPRCVQLHRLRRGRAVVAGGK
jgi:hypothetical protein